MRVLLLTARPERLSPALRLTGDDFLVETAPIEVDWCRKEKIDWIVSYGYRHIIRAPMLAMFSERAVNLHISYLPWNRGADPNLWSWIDDTPKGVTLHVIDNGIDTGPILAQQQVTFGPEETLATSYTRLQSEAESLFLRSWPSVRSGELKARAQVTGGSSHRAVEGAPILAALPNGWGTCVNAAAQIGRSMRR